MFSLHGRGSASEASTTVSGTAGGLTHPKQAGNAHTWPTRALPSRILLPETGVAPTQHIPVLPWEIKGLLASKDTDLLEDFWAEPGQDLDAVFGEIVDCTLPLPMADHAKIAT